MLSIWRISWRNITQNKKRFFFTLLAIVLGTSFITSMLIADRTTNDVFHYYEQMYIGDADYWVLSDDHTFTEERIRSIEQDPEVTETLLALDKQAFFELEGDRSLNERSVRITGVSDQSSTLLKLPVVEGSLDNEGLVVPETVADLLDKGVGDTIRFEGLGEAKISAIVEYTQLLASPGDWEGAASASFRVMAPLDLLRDWTGKTDEISYLRFQTEGDGEALFFTMQEELQDSGVYIQPVVADDLQSNDIGGLYTFFYIIAGLAMFISGFIVFNMIYTSVIERKHEFAIMKSLGYTQSSVSKLVLVEMLLLSVIGTVVSIPLGIWLGDLFMQALLSVFAFDMVYTLNWKIPALVAVIIGLVYPILFSLFPIYHAGKTSILLTLKKENKTEASIWKSVRMVVGAGLLFFALIDHPMSYAAVILGVIFLFPLLLIGLGKLSKPLLKGIFHHSGTMAVKHLHQQLNRNSNTATILAVGVSVLLLFGAVIESAPQGYEKEIKETYGGDMRVTSEMPWTPEDIMKILSYDAVTAVTPLAEATPITWETMEGVKRQFSVISASEEGPALWKDWEEDAVEQEGSIVLGERAFAEWGGSIGQQISINAPNGVQAYRVADVVKTSHHSGYVAYMKEEPFEEEFGWRNSFDLLVSINGADDAVRDQLWVDFKEHLSKVKTAEEEVDSTTSAITGMNELLMAMLIITIGLASIGTANTLLMNTYERKFELGTMRALGFTKQQVRSMIVAEGLLIGLSGVIGGVITGMLFIYMTSNSSMMEGFMSYQFPVSNIILAMIAGISLSLCAAWISGNTATKMDIQSSLKEGR